MTLTGSSTGMGESTGSGLVNVWASIENLVYGSVLPDAKVLMFSSPQFCAAFQDQEDAKYLLLGLQPSQRMQFIRNYCGVTGTSIDSLAVITRILEQSSSGGSQLAEKKGLKRRPVGKSPEREPTIKDSTFTMPHGSSKIKGSGFDLSTISAHFGGEEVLVCYSFSLHSSNSHYLASYWIHIICLEYCSFLHISSIEVLLYQFCLMVITLISFN